MTAQLDLGGITVDVVFRDIKHVHLSVYPPTGRVRIAAPERMSLDTIRLFAITKLDWIKRHQRQVRSQDRETPREYLDRESHYLWGKRYLLKIVESPRSSVELQHSRLVLHVPPDPTVEKKEAVLSRWYRAQLRAAVPPLLATWQPFLGINAEKWYVQHMKTMWGSCNPTARTIRLNTELAKKPRECLEYILVHELTHLLEPTHNARFLSLMDSHMPTWRHHRAQLNQLPVRHEDWMY